MAAFMAFAAFPAHALLCLAVKVFIIQAIPESEPIIFIFIFLTPFPLPLSFGILTL